MIEKLKKLADAGYITDVTLFRALNENPDLKININDYITQVGINVDEILGEIVEEPAKEPEVEPAKEPEELPTVDTGDDEE